MTTPLFSEAGRKRLDAIVLPGLLCAFDFDGTLAPIVEHPEHVRLPHDILQRLSSLSCFAPIAIITGRSVGDIRRHIGFRPDFVVGNHGLEGVAGLQNNIEAYQALCRIWLEKLTTALQNQTRFDPGIWIEDKRYSLTVHYRSAHDQQQTEQQLAAAISQLTPSPHVIKGKGVFNLVPQGAANKGDALMKLLSLHGFQNALYVGDDVTDEDVFRLRDPHVLTVRVEHATTSAAEFYLPTRMDVSRLLVDLIERLRALRQKSPMPIPSSNQHS